MPLSCWVTLSSTLFLTYNHLCSDPSKRNTLPKDFIARGTPWQFYTISLPIFTSLGLLVSCPFLNAICLNKDQDRTSKRPSRVYIATGLVISTTNFIRVVITILLPLALPINRLCKFSHLWGFSFHTSSKTSKYFFWSIFLWSWCCNCPCCGLQVSQQWYVIFFEQLLLHQKY